MDPVKYSPKIRSMLERAKHDYDEATVAGLTVTTVPEGARIFVNGKYIGDSPLTRNRKVGHHFVTVSKFGFKEWSNKVTIKPGLPTSFNIALEKPPPPPLIASQLMELVRSGQIDPGAPDQLAALADGAEVSWIWIVERDQEKVSARLFSRPHGKLLTTVQVRGEGAADPLASQMVAFHRLPVDEMAAEAEGDAFYQTWWFWTLIGVVVAGGATTATLLLWPEGETRYHLQFGR
jgi:hypothetical protein